ncbi:MAG: hypothetical protein ABIF08_04385 [Nanoarchaeota archaeon]
MNTRDFKVRNTFLISSVVTLTTFIFYYLGNQLIGSATDAVKAITVSLLVGVFYFIVHHYLNRYSKKRHNNVAVNEFL